MLDESSRAYRDSGIGYLKLDDDELLNVCWRTKRLLRLPLVRVGNIVAVGVDEKAWKDAITAAA